MRSMIFAFLSTVLIAGCGQESVTNPRFQPEIVNLPDSYSFQATNVTNVTETVQYTWQNTGTAANVNLSSQLTAGSATLIILDAANQQVYSSSLTANGTFVTANGQSGAWTIRVVLSGVAGTLNFRVQKRT